MRQMYHVCISVLIEFTGIALYYFYFDEIHTLNFEYNQGVTIILSNLT